MKERSFFKEFKGSLGEFLLKLKTLLIVIFIVLHGKFQSPKNLLTLEELTTNIKNYS
jgi:hypothetical protein